MKYGGCDVRLVMGKASRYAVCLRFRVERYGGVIVNHVGFQVSSKSDFEM